MQTDRKIDRESKRVIKKKTENEASKDGRGKD